MSDDEIAGDPEMYDCEACPVMGALDGLDPDNRRAWRVYREAVSRLAADLHCGAEVLRRLTATVADEDWPDLWARLSLLYDTVNPPPADDETT